MVVKWWWWNDVCRLIGLALSGGLAGIQRFAGFMNIKNNNK